MADKTLMDFVGGKEIEATNKGFGGSTIGEPLKQPTSNSKPAISCARYVPHSIRGCLHHHAGRCGVIMTGCSHNKKFGGYKNGN